MLPILIPPIQVHRLWNHHPLLKSPANQVSLLPLRTPYGTHPANQRHLPKRIHLLNLQSSLLRVLQDNPHDSHLFGEVNLLLALPNSLHDNHLTNPLHLQTGSHLLNLQSSLCLVLHYNLRDNHLPSQVNLPLVQPHDQASNHSDDPQDNQVNSRKRVHPVLPRLVQQASLLTAQGRVLGSTTPSWISDPTRTS
jgi:hypothetical protein